MADIRIEKYEEKWADKWDDFVCNKSMNGTFLQTRKFINYHKEGKFKDHSLIFFRGNEMVACILACVIEEDNETILFSHKGTTFGGLILSENVYNTSLVNDLMDRLVEHSRAEQFSMIYLKQTPDLFAKKSTELVDYFLYQKGFEQFSELNFYIDLTRYTDDVLAQFSSSKRRDYRYSLNHHLQFKKLTTKSEIEDYYQVLQLNLQKLGLRSVHSLDDLLDLYFNRFSDRIEFYGVHYEDKLIAGSMLFWFSDKIVHTQYLSSNQNYLSMYPMDFLIYNLIQMAVNRNANVFTFGICTEDQGRYINLGLSRFKEGFGVKYTINKSFEKKVI